MYIVKYSARVHMAEDAGLGVKRVTEPNRTIGSYRTESTEISDSCGTGFYRSHRTELFGVSARYLGSTYLV